MELPRGKGCLTVSRLPEAPPIWVVGTFLVTNDLATTDAFNMASPLAELFARRAAWPLHQVVDSKPEGSA